VEVARLHSLYDSIPCLPDLLKEEGYATGFFQSSTAYFENFRGLVTNLGYEEYYPLETMDVG
jgi:lipoteichoic acid synthase